ncbi:MAG: hypothetical protein QXX08_11575 [Candidatus Bathyarchaeia archaeon]
MYQKGHLTKRQRQKLSYLFDMEYTPRELAEILSISFRQFYRVYIPAGCPYRREGKRYFINGKKFYEWYIKNYPDIHLSPNQAYCVSCKKPVEIQGGEVHEKGSYRYQKFRCPNCDHFAVKSLRRNLS